MRHYKVGRDTFTARDAADLVDQIGRASRDGNPPDGWMERSADRFYAATGRQLDTSDPEAYVRDCIAAGLIEEAN